MGKQKYKLKNIRTGRGADLPQQQPRSQSSSAILGRKSLNKNDRDQVLWARETEHPTQTLVFTKTAGRHNLVEVVVI